MSEDLEFLKSVLSVPTKTYKEDLMVDFIIAWCEKRKPHLLCGWK